MSTRPYDIVRIFGENKWNMRRAICGIVLSGILIFSVFHASTSFSFADAAASTEKQKISHQKNIKNYIPKGVKVIGNLAEQCKPLVNDAFGYLQAVRFDKSQTYAQYVAKYVHEINCSNETPGADGWYGGTTDVPSTPYTISIFGDRSNLIECVNKEDPNHPLQPNFKDWSFGYVFSDNPDDIPKNNGMTVYDASTGTWYSVGNYDPCAGISWKNYVHAVKGTAGVIAHEATHAKQFTTKNWFQNHPGINIEWDATKVEGLFFKTVGLQYGFSKTREESYESFMIFKHQMYFNTDMSVEEFRILFGHEPAPGTEGVSNAAAAHPT